MDQTSRPRRAAAPALAALAAALGLVNLATVVATGRLDLLLSPDAWLPLSAAAVGWLVVHQVPENPVGWLLLTMALSSALFGASALLVAVGVSGLVGMLAAWLSTWVWLPSYLVAFWFLPMLFPDGRPVGPRWRPAVAGSTVLLAVEALLLGLGTPESIEPHVPNPFFIGPVGSVMSAAEPVIFLSMTLLVVLGVLSLLYRFVRARGQARVQILAVLVAATVGVAYFLLTQSGLLLAVLLPAAIAVAVLRFRLYDVERLLARTIVYGGLAASAAAIYTVLVLAATRLVGVTDDLRLQSTVIVVAVLVIHPLRDRILAGANRLVYGRRADPYAALASLAREVGAAVSPEETLPVMATAIAEALSAEAATVRAVVGHGAVSATSPAGPRASTGGQPDGSSAVSEVWHHGEVVGSIEVRRPDPLTPREADLLGALAAQAGPALRTVGLTAMLRAELDRAVKAAADLRESRARLVNAHDTARRRIERDLHDGAQQGLLAIAVELGRIQRRVGVDPSEAMARLGELQDLARRTLVDLRALASGTYPPVLRELGVGAALRERVDALAVPVHLEDRLPGRSDRALESAVYFGCLEAITNAAKHARASAVHVSLEEPAPGRVEFTVADDGVGFDNEDVVGGTGLEGIADRLGVFDGEVVVQSSPGAGTTVRGWGYDTDSERYSNTA